MRNRILAFAVAAIILTFTHVSASVYFYKPVVDWFLYLGASTRTADNISFMLVLVTSMVVYVSFMVIMIESFDRVGKK